MTGVSRARRRADRAGRCRPGRPGTVAGAVLRAARTSASATEACLAAAAGAAEDEIRCWEDGTRPLSGIPLPRFEQLEAALVSLGGQPPLVADMAAAAWCDLIIHAISQAEDVTCLLADPMATMNGFHELLAWALTGHAPARYRRYVIPGAPLIDPALAAPIMCVLTAAAVPGRLLPTAFTR